MQINTCTYPYKNFQNKFKTSNENNFYNFQKNNIKMNRVKKSVEKVNTSNENYLKESNGETVEENKKFKITQYPIIKKSQTGN